MMWQSKSNLSAIRWGVFPARRPLAAQWGLLACVVVLSLQTTSARAETWAEKLGFPPDQRVLILHAEKMGMCFESNEMGQKLLDGSQVQSVSALVPGPWFAEFAEWSQRHPDHDIGLSIALHTPWKYSRWRPISPRSEVPGLVDVDGFFTRNALQFSFNAKPEEVEREMRAQIEYARAQGLSPSHLRSHDGILFTRVDLAEVYLELARKYWIPAVVVELTPDHITRFREEGFPLDDRMIDLIADYPLPKVDDFQFLPWGESLDEKREKFLKLVEELPPGITQIVGQPAAESAGLKRLSESWQQQVWDAELLSDPQLRQTLEKQGVAFTDWKQIMRRFHAGGPTKDEP